MLDEPRVLPGSPHLYFPDGHQALTHPQEAVIRGDHRGQS